MLPSAFHTDKITCIAIVVPAIAREGITKQVANQIVGLTEKGVKVTLIVLATSDVNVLAEYGVNVKELKVLQLCQPDHFLSYRALRQSFSLALPIQRFLKAEQVNYVIAHAPYAHFTLRLVKMISIVVSYEFKLIQYFHGLQYSEFPANTWKRKAVNLLNRWLAARYDDAHISISNVVKQEISEYLIRHRNHAVLYNSSAADSWNDQDQCDWEEVKKLLDRWKGRYIIMLPGRIDPNKGQLFFLDVFCRFLRLDGASVDDIAVLVVGDGPQRQELEEKVQEEDLKEVVAFTGSLTNGVVQKLMQHVSLVVVPSFKEGFGFAALEAMQAGAVLLASDSGGLKEVVKDGETGYLFKAGNKDDCLQKLKMLYANRNAQLLDQNIVKHYVEEKFSSEKYLKQLLHLIYQL